MSFSVASDNGVDVEYNHAAIFSVTTYS